MGYSRPSHFHVFRVRSHVCDESKYTDVPIWKPCNKHHRILPGGSAAVTALTGMHTIAVSAHAACNVFVAQLFCLGLFLGCHDLRHGGRNAIHTALRLLSSR